MDKDSTQNNFEIALKFVLEHEGRLTKDSDDAGGITDYGISLRFLKLNHIDINHDGVIDERDILNLDYECAAHIYKEYFWDKGNYNKINDLKIAKKIFDFSVNMGISAANKILQRSINCYILDNKKLEFNYLSVDGIIGNKTLKILNCIGTHDKNFYDIICDQAYGFYQKICDKNPKLKKFLNGWKNRAFS